MSRILWVATADARGHLMRCQLLARALDAAGIAVDVVTTSEEGRVFLEAFGVRAALLSPHYRVEFDDRQNMSRPRTEWRIVRYVASPRRFRRDLAWLVRRAQGARLVVDDSFHPALLLAPRLQAGRLLPPVVHVYGHDLRAALEQHFTGRLPRALARRFQAGMAATTDRAFARIEHAIDAPPGGLRRGDAAAPRTFVLPPAVALPAAPRAGARAALGLGVGSRARLAAVYLNPHFRDPAIAAAIERALPGPAFVRHAVGEGFAGRPGWRPRDPALADVLGAADLFVSAPGMGAIAQARALGIPFLALVTDQPEQVANVERLRATGHPFAVVRVTGARDDEDDLAARLAVAATELLARSAAQRPAAQPASAVPLWVDVLSRLLDEARALEAARHDHHPRIAA